MEVSPDVSGAGPNDMRVAPDSEEETPAAGSHEEASQNKGARRSRYIRAEGGSLPSLTAQKVAILRYLAELRFLSLPQLARLTCPSEKSARRHLRELFDAALVDVVPVARAALAPAKDAGGAQLLHGSAPNVYVPTEAGLRLLVEAGHLSPELLRRAPPKYGPKNSLFLAHELLVREVRVWLEATAAAHDGQRVLKWQDGKDAVLPLPQGGAARPDAWFVQQILPERPPAAGQPTGPARPLVLVGLAEIDRGTERGGLRWGEKLEAYLALFSDRPALAASTGYVNARVLVLAPDALRRDGLAAWLERRVNELRMPPDILSRFWLAEQEVLARTDLGEACWRRPGGNALRPLVSQQTLKPLG